jgi:hypothetical protein
LLDEVFDPFSLYNYCSPVQGEHFFAGVAQLVEQLIRNQQVSGSSPLAGFPKQHLRYSNGFHEMAVDDRPLRLDQQQKPTKTKGYATISRCDSDSHHEAWTDLNVSPHC